MGLLIPGIFVARFFKRFFNSDFDFFFFGFGFLVVFIRGASTLVKKNVVDVVETPITSVFALLDNIKMFEQLQDLYITTCYHSFGVEVLNANTVYLRKKKSPLDPKTTQWSVLIITQR